MKRFLLAALLFAVAAAIPVTVRAQPKVDEPLLLFHLRETFGIPSGVDMKLGDWQKSEINGLWRVKLTLSRGDQSQERDVLVSDDGKYYLVADIEDLSKLPDAQNLKLLDIAGAPSKGPKDAKITIVEFTDFECPYCKRAHESLEDNLFKTFGDKVRLVYKAYPLTGIHPWSQEASLAGACVAKLEPKRFWSFADAMFQDQEDIDADVLSADHRSADQDKVKAKLVSIAAESAKVNKEKFLSCIDDKATLDAVEKDQAEGDALGVNSTPTLFVNGHRLTGYSGFDNLKDLIDEMLAGKHGPVRSS